MEPDYSLINREVDGIHLGLLLKRINERLEFLLDRDHRIGHAYLYNVASLSDLQKSFKRQIIPLLQEFFFEDLARVAQVLASNSTANLIDRETLAYTRIFPQSTAAVRDRFRYAPTPQETWQADVFRGIYAAPEEELSSGEDQAAD